jgi:predicted small lipoprotein YifL
MRIVKQVLCLVVLSGLLAACGVKGDLDPPSGAEQRKDEPIVLDKII